MNEKDGLRVCWTGGAGVLLTYGDKTLGIDLYFSNSCMTADGQFKRITPPPWPAMDTAFDYLICSHEHGDHVDLGSMEGWFKGNERLLLGPSPVLEQCEKLVPAERRQPFNRGSRLSLGPFTVTSVYCDHGELSPEAVGVLVETGKQKVYFTGDMSYRPDFTAVTATGPVDLLILPINGQYGNPDAEQAAAMTAMLSPRYVLPCHYWLFVEHGGDPSAFAAACSKYASETRVLLGSVGEWLKIE